MNDFLFIATVVVFFLISSMYVRLHEVVAIRGYRGYCAETLRVLRRLVRCLLCRLEASVRLKFILESVSVKPTVAEIAL